MTEDHQPDERSWVTVPPHIRTRRLDDETVILDLLSESYFSLQGVGTRLWELVNAGLPRFAVLAQLGREFDVDPGVLAVDVDDLVALLQRRDLLTTGGTNGARA